MAIWKALIASGVRVYFSVEKNGSLVTGIDPGDFSALLIEPGDTDSAAIVVAESAQKPGIYFGDLPSAFLTTHGGGQYGLSLGVHSTGPTNVDAETLLSVEVNAQDINNLVLNSIVDGFLDRADAIETGVTLRKAHRAQLSEAAGKTRDFQINAPKFRNVTDTKDRIVATQDANGNRTSVTLDLT